MSWRLGDVHSKFANAQRTHRKKWKPTSADDSDAVFIATEREAFSTDNMDLSRDDLRWATWQLFSFRLVAVYLLLSWFTVYGVLQIIPFFGFRLEGWLEALWNVPVRWAAIHLFHLTGIAAQFHATDSRDTALDWIAAGLVVSAAIVLAVLWSCFDRRRRNYAVASDWLRYIMRLALVFLMLRYALIKIFPLQMLPPSLAVLNEPLGSSSPMTLFWTMVGMHPGYEMLVGWIEALTACLLLVRRTALLGALLTIVVMSNVLIDNLFFDIPVKIGAANLLILAIAIAAPDLGRLWQIFVRHQTTSLSSRWAPTSANPRVRLGLRVSEVLFFAGALIQFLPSDATGYRELQAHLRHPSILTGLWHVDSVVLQKNGLNIPMPVLTGLGQPVVGLSFEPDGTLMARAADGMLWRAYAEVNAADHTVDLESGYFDGERFNATYSFFQPDVNHLILTPTSDLMSARGKMTLTRVPLPAHYPLLERRFQWVNEWALER